MSPVFIIKINDLIYIQKENGKLFKADHGVFYGMIVYQLHEEITDENIDRTNTEALSGYKFVSESVLADISTIPITF